MDLVALLLAGGLAGIIALPRIGMRHFWGPAPQTPRLRVIEAGPMAVLLLACVAMTVQAGHRDAYFDADRQRASLDRSATSRAVLAAPRGRAAP